MYFEYKGLCNKGQFNLGDVFEYETNEGFIYNLATQKSWRTNATLDAIEKSFTKMLEMASVRNLKQIAIPKIGAGLGSLDWDEVFEIIKKASSKYSNINI